MKSINLLSIVQAYNSLTPLLFRKYLDYFNANVRDGEVEDIEKFIFQLSQFNPRINIFDNYYLGYTIPQIGKEFDLLRFGNNYSLNLEIKRESTFEKVKKQILRNRYYLSFLKSEIHIYSYISNDNKLYCLDDNDNLVEKELKQLIQLIHNQEISNPSSINDCFNPSNYLVSPFNSTESFMKGKYFLTHQQEDIKRTVNLSLQKIDATFISICGKAGTGKTLLAYDIVKEQHTKGFKTLVIHCGILNEGHDILINEFAWDIIAIRHLNNITLQDYSLILIDEAQRIYPNQLNQIIKDAKNYNINCIFSYDQLQWLRKMELKNNIDRRIVEIPTITTYELTEKIRTNKEIAMFIKGLFDRSKVLHNFDSSNIEINYFRRLQEALGFMGNLHEMGWKIINLTPSSVDPHPYDKYIVRGQKNAHGVIGQEFEKVVSVIDPYYVYVNNKLSVQGYTYSPYYDPVQMLYQIMTRTRSKLKVIIINNPILLERCLELTNGK
tara:strand:- start:487 stop:1971 length:1485 start_codon:yes stop_codon:yes gene_type:complete